LGRRCLGQSVEIRCTIVGYWSPPWLSGKRSRVGGREGADELAGRPDRLLWWPVGTGSGRLGGDPVVVEAEEVVGRGDQSPFRAHGRSPAAVEPVDLAVELLIAAGRRGSRLKG